jgi:hypothetical protein
MTELEWLNGTSPEQMWEVVERKATNRKRRLFACACYRHVPKLFRDPRCLHAVIISERYADGEASKEELAKALTTSQHWFPWFWPSSLPTARNAGNARAVAARASADGLQERLYQCAALRCLFGNPFRARPMRPQCTSPSDGSAWLAVAKLISDEGAFEQMPLLADAREDGGYTDESVLTHLRGPGPHVRGCWALDLILGKQ